MLRFCSREIVLGDVLTMKNERERMRRYADNVNVGSVASPFNLSKVKKKNGVSSPRHSRFIREAIIIYLFIGIVYLSSFQRTTEPDSRPTNRETTLHFSLVVRPSAVALLLFTYDSKRVIECIYFVAKSRAHVLSFFLSPRKDSYAVVWCE